MKGYTIENSIDLLEKDVKALKEGGGGGGGASTWNQLQGKPFNALGDELYNLDGDLTVNTISADKIALPESSEHSWDYLSQAIEALAEDVNHFSDDIAELETKVGEIYTFEEKQVGTFAGQPLYRKIVQEPFGSYPNGHTVSIGVEHFTPVNYHAFRIAPDGTIFKAYSSPSSGYYFQVDRFGNDGIMYRSAGWNSGYFRAIVEYTKNGG